ncbi:RHS repeat-associated core domain-containing protein [Pseudomonas sp. GM55]|uniref:RHS repeat-associated core domain-containing protein n=1 Tax=Pseudomonas sp. GM55 TaxID=1144333 RepID=UPI000270C6CB|nr:RHS repeat-associated core domain-containing protein [Pseudomonas sp. GM55]EJM68045.1 RHS repeat-associated core domain protein-containing protein [Pseudomonas sp. GM55]
MPASPRETVLCHYHYDALDRLDNSAPSTLDSLQRFYCKTRLATEIQGSVRNSIFQHEDQLLAQQRHANARIENTLLATDQQRSVLNTLSATGPQPATYTPYGHRSPENGLLSLLGFNGERRDPLTGHYPLGNGYRQFNPVLMRLSSPDSLSPFGDGGLNTYAYCVGDPVNLSDPTGHLPFLSILIGTSLTVAVGALVGSQLVEDKTVKGVLVGLSIAAASLATLGFKMKVNHFVRNRRLQPRDSIDSRRRSIALQQLSPGSRHRELPPGYWPESRSSPLPDRALPPPYEISDRTLPHINSRPPSYSEFSSPIGGRHPDSQSLTSQPLPSPARSTTHSLSSESGRIRLDT